MKIAEQFFNGAFILDAEPHTDTRGEFTRLYCEHELAEVTGGRPVVQINHTHTKNRGAIRGLHYQRSPKSETKIIRCVRGSLFNVIVDLRAGSSTFLQWRGHLLSEKNNRMIYIPSGFAHGAQILEDDTAHIMFHTDFYSRDHEAGIHYDEPMVGIQWPLDVSDLSEKDRLCPYLQKDYKGIEIFDTFNLKEPR